MYHILYTDDTYKKNKVTVSVITPLYNAKDYIERTIKSVQAQTFKDWEHIIVDDCSTDKGAEIVEKWSAKDSRITFLKNETNSGPAVTRNKAIEAAKGRYIAFLDSDDQWKRNKLEVQLRFMQEKETPFSFTYYDQIDEQGIKIGVFNNIPLKVNYTTTLKNNKIGCLTVIYDTQFFGKTFMPLIKKRQDYALWLKLLKRIDYAYCLPESLAIYTVRTSSVSSNKFGLIKYNWQVYRDFEEYSVLKSAYYLSCIVINKLRRRT